MRILFFAGPTYGLIFPLAPPAWAARSAGHDILFTGPANTGDAVIGAGFPFTACAPELQMGDVMMVDRLGRRMGLPTDEGEMLAQMGGGFARLAARCFDGLLDLVDRWQPDLIVGTTFHYGPALVAAARGIPWVAQGCELGLIEQLDAAAWAELRPELAAAGWAGCPEPAMLLDVCPPSLRAPDATGRPVRFVPFNADAVAHPWMMEDDRPPRVCLTLGSRVAAGKVGGFETLRRLVGSLCATLPDPDAEVVVAATNEVVEALRPLPRRVRAGWLPIDVLVRSCDVVVHHGGGNTMLACLAAGVPQVLLPYMVNNRVASRRLGAAGLAVVLEPGEDTDENVTAAVARVLSEPGFREAARRVAGEISALESPRELMPVLEQVAREGRRPVEVRLG